MDTARHTYGDLSSEIFLNSGGVSFSVTAFPDLKNGGFTGLFAASVRVLYEKLDFGFEILKEILTESILEDEKRLREILKRGEIQEPDAAHEFPAIRPLSPGPPPIFRTFPTTTRSQPASIISSLWSSGYGSLTVKRERSSQALRESWGPFLQGTT